MAVLSVASVSCAIQNELHNRALVFFLNILSYKNLSFSDYRDGKSIDSPRIDLLSKSRANSAK